MVIATVAHLNAALFDIVCCLDTGQYFPFMLMIGRLVAQTVLDDLAIQGLIHYNIIYTQISPSPRLQLAEPIKTNFPSYQGGSARKLVRIKFESLP